jgi:hypothetical protein
MTKSYLTLFLLFFTFTSLWMFGCDWMEDPEDRGPAPSDCIDEPFETGYLYIRSTINSQNDSVPIYVYYGNLTDNQLDTFFYSTTTMKSLIRPLGEYSVVAEYLRGKDTIVVFDGDNIDDDETEYSDKSCWSLDNAHVDMRLKF